MANWKENRSWEYRVALDEAGFCGAAVAASLVRFWTGNKVAQREIIEAAGLTVEEVCREEKDVGGIDPGRLKTAMENLAPSCRVMAKLRSKIGDLKEATDNGYPVIVAWQTTDEDNVAPPPDNEDWGHYSIVVRVSERRVYISDPSGDQEKVRRIKRPFFAKRWWDRNEGVEYQQLMMVMVPKERNLDIPGLNCDILKS